MTNISLKHVGDYRLGALCLPTQKLRKKAHEMWLAISNVESSNTKDDQDPVLLGYDLAA